MRCDHDILTHSKVVDTNPEIDGGRIIGRVRKCLDCQETFTTVEITKPLVGVNRRSKGWEKIRKEFLFPDMKNIFAMCAKLTCLSCAKERPHTEDSIQNRTFNYHKVEGSPMICNARKIWRAAWREGTHGN